MGVPESVEAAKSELEALDGWLKDFFERQQMVANTRERMAFLSGFITAKEAESQPPSSA